MTDEHHKREGHELTKVTTDDAKVTKRQVGREAVAAALRQQDPGDTGRRAAGR